MDTHARDTLNTHDLCIRGGYPTLAHETGIGRREDQRKQHQTTRWYVHTYLHADEPDTLPLGEDVLEGLQFSGNPNYGYAAVQLKDTRMVSTSTNWTTRGSKAWHPHRFNLRGIAAVILTPVSV